MITDIIQDSTTNTNNIYSDLTSSGNYTADQVKELQSMLDGKTITNDVSQELQSMIDGQLDFDELKSQFSNVTNKLNDLSNTPSIDISTYLPSVDFSLSNVISSAQSSISSTLSNISSQISVLLSPLSIPDYDLSSLQLSAKQLVDNMKQKAAQMYDQTISTIQKTVKTVMEAMYGWIDTSESNTNVISSGMSIGSLWSKATSLIAGLPIAITIPGLNAITGLITSLSTMTSPAIDQIPTTEELQEMVKNIQQNGDVDSLLTANSIEKIKQLSEQATQNSRKTTII